MTVSVTIDTPTNSASTTAMHCPIWITRLRSIRSATAPPNKASDNMGIANPAFTRPRMNGDDVSS